MPMDADPDEAGVYRVGDEGNRATVAMVLRTVDDLKAITQAHFQNVHSRLDLLNRLPDEVHAMKERQLLLDARITVIEKSDAMQQSAAERKRDYARGTLPLILIGVLSTLANVVIFVVHP